MNTRKAENFKEIDDFYEEELQADLVLIQRWIEQKIIAESRKPKIEHLYNQIFPPMHLVRQAPEPGPQTHTTTDLNSYFLGPSHVSPCDPSLKWQASENDPQIDPKVTLREHVTV